MARRVTAGVAMMMLSGGALIVVFADPGVKLIVIVTAGYALTRIVIGLVTPASWRMSKERRREM